MNNWSSLLKSYLKSSEIRSSSGRSASGPERTPRPHAQCIHTLALARDEVALLERAVQLQLSPEQRLVALLQREHVVAVEAAIERGATPGAAGGSECRQAPPV